MTEPVVDSTELRNGAGLGDQRESGAVADHL